jgi:hypothetical protein
MRKVCRMTDIITGVCPRPGERALVSPIASYDVHRPVWVYVERTESAFLPGWIYLIGRPIRSDGTTRDRCRLYCHVEALRVARAGW